MLVMTTIGVHAQFSITNSTQRRVIVAYDPGSDGYYKRVTNKSVERVDNIAVWGHDIQILSFLVISIATYNIVNTLNRLLGYSFVITIASKFISDNYSSLSRIAYRKLGMYTDGCHHQHE